ncbi:hypothetical protein [Candidatus Reidiella endopervernicosa]|uniref:Uncharacterized protein n=1 Tax=Candidatus Reidiella endopervernicosa TaxID=2738883 RepID=A0A6N0HUH5_9GAMM|nr:hypothetical protein [Candidatus Reidiella endopervernicosa]QKQ26064.1 hypothetical protein HUE57_07035 [Candidatus Reidiella endopervernicosa]
MGVTITLTDKELPASPAFIEFVHATLTDSDYDVGEWFYQEGESLARNDGRFKDIREKAQFVVGHPIGSKMQQRLYVGVESVRELCRAAKR